MFGDDDFLNPFGDKNGNGYYDAEDRWIYENYFGDDDEAAAGKTEDEDEEGDEQCCSTCAAADPSRGIHHGPADQTQHQLRKVGGGTARAAGGSEKAKNHADTEGGGEKTKNDVSTAGDNSVGKIVVIVAFAVLAILLVVLFLSGMPLD